MAKRPVFYVSKGRGFCNVFNTEIEWAGGFAVSQSRKNIAAIHSQFETLHPEMKVLEISSKSENEVGVRASAFNLKKFVPSLNASVEVEKVYQGSKVFQNGGPFSDLITTDKSKSAKGDDRLRNSGRLIKFQFEGKDYPNVPESAFYNFLYINALLENPEIANEILKYDAFTDIVFNPAKSISCQAQAAAIFVSLSRAGLIDKVRDFDSFVETVYSVPKVESVKTESKPEPKAPEIAMGTIIIHKAFGRGVVTATEPRLVIRFDSGEEKILGVAWVSQNCEVINEN
ncbi:MAG: hypothetical protein IKU25_01035 [Clostridia bacterium]|nr:hypothetical protein [Clostridia bacterium]